MSIFLIKLTDTLLRILSFDKNIFAFKVDNKGLLTSSDVLFIAVSFINTHQIIQMTIQRQASVQNLKDCNHTELLAR